MSTISIKPILQKRVSLGIVSVSPMIQHKWSEKALKQMRDKHAGKKSKNREIRDPEAEGWEAAYKTTDGSYGTPAMAVKASILSAAHRDFGLPRTTVMKALFIHCKDAHGVIPFASHSDPFLREDVVRVAQSTDLRYRPQFNEWSLHCEFEVDAELLTTEDLVNLVKRAGFGVGIGEWRPEKGGEFGRFEVDTSIPVEG